MPTDGQKVLKTRQPHPVDDHRGDPLAGLELIEAPEEDLLPIPGRGAISLPAGDSAAADVVCLRVSTFASGSDHILET